MKLDFNKFVEIIQTDFVDLYIYKDYLLIKDFNNIKKIVFKEEVQIKNIIDYVNKINEMNKVNIKIDYGKENFSFYFNDGTSENNELQGYRGVYGQEIKGEYINIRKLGKPRDLEKFIEDPLLKKMIAGSFLYNQGTIISGKTGSGKTTLLISFLSFLNNKDPKSYELNKKYKFIKHYLGVNIDKSETENYFNNNISEDSKNLFYTNLNEDVLYKMLVYIEKENRKIIYTTENPIEYYFKSKNINFIQNDIFLHGKQEIVKNKIKWNEKITDKIKEVLYSIDDIYKEGINYTKGNGIVEQTNIFGRMLRTNPDFALIGEIRTQVEFDNFLLSVAVGIPTYTTLHSDDAFSTLQRLYDTSSLSHLEKINLISSAIYGIVNNKIFFSKALNKVIPFFDILFLEDSTVRLELYNFLKDGQLYKLREKYEDLGTKKISEDKWKVIYLNKKTSLLYNLYRNYYNNSLLQDENIMNKWIEELKFLFDRYQIKEYDVDKFPSYYYHYVDNITNNDFSIFKEFLKDNNILN